MTEKINDDVLEGIGIIAQAEEVKKMKAQKKADNERTKACKSIMKASRKVLVINWYDKDDLESILNRNLTEEEYAYIIDEWEYSEIITENIIAYIHTILDDTASRSQR